ncbi:MAG: DegT/DnrJ/EryC1/StrS family aminotransferase [bacterium]|nr:DegT/DnrJ/EryC1/StrS family aminotransferase [bacterium]
MSRLAILGGPPVLDRPLSVRWPQFDATDEKALLDVFRSGKWWRGGTIGEQAAGPCGQFERDFAAWHSARHGLVCCNGTIAVELALHAAGVQPGDEVIVPAMSFVVSASAVLPLGAVPVFADCNPETLQTDADAIEAAITSRTTAIVLVHFGGYPADLDRITKIARKHKLALIEDCAHAQGTQWRGKGVGSYGDYGTFSFQQSKGLTCGEGGIVLCRTKTLWHRAYRYHNLGRYEDKGFYDFYVMSSNLRLTDLQGALLNTQFEKLQQQLPHKMDAAAFLSQGLRELGGLEPLPDDKRITRRGFYYYLMRYDADAFGGVSRTRFREALQAEGVPLGQSYGQAIHKYPLFQDLQMPRKYTGAQYKKTRCPNAERAATETVCTLSHQLLLSDRQSLAKVLDAVAKVKDNIDELVGSGSGRKSAGGRRAR